VPLVTAGDIAQKLQGTSLDDVVVSLWVNGKKYFSVCGEMLFTHFGLSGPAIFSLSRYAVKN